MCQLDEAVKCTSINEGNSTEFKIYGTAAVIKQTATSPEHDFGLDSSNLGGQEIQICHEQRGSVAGGGEMIPKHYSEESISNLRAGQRFLEELKSRNL